MDDHSTPPNLRQTPEPLRLCLVGCGGIAAAHLPAIVNHPDQFRLVAVADPNPANRKAVIQEVRQSESVREFSEFGESLAAMADTVEAVLVLTPHHLHFPAAMEAVKAGKPVLVEKPVCLNLEETRRLREAAERSGVPVMVGQTRRFAPASRRIREWIREKPEHFGALRTFEVSGWQNIEAWIASKPDRNADFWILDKKRAGGGVVVSLLVHALDLVRYLFDTDFVTVAAQGRWDPPFRNGAESAACALLTTDNGAVGTLHANYLAPKVPYCETFKAIGQYGVVGDHPVLGQYAGPAFRGTTGGHAPDGWNFQFGGVEAFPETGGPGLAFEAFTAQLLEFAAAIREEREPESSIQRNFNSMAVVEALYASLENGGRAVEVARS